MTQEEITKIKIELTADILKTLIQEKTKRGFSNSLFSDAADGNAMKNELVGAAAIYANKIIAYILNP